ncbi:MAG: hypothetical protein O7D32_11255 [bacterium]|nr:hypothetical protein [bacterium]
MKNIIVLIAVISIGYAGNASALVGIGFGVELSSVNYSGDILPGSGDLGGGTAYGAMLYIGALPVIDLELHVNYFTQDFTYTYNVLAVPVPASFTYQDLSTTILLKKNLISLPMSPLQVYVGGGVGWHLMNTEVAAAIAGGSLGPENADNPIELFKYAAKTSAEGLVGLRLSFPVLPFALYGDARFGYIFATEKIRTTQIAGGIMLKF